jgi:hypothetical protein
MSDMSTPVFKIHGGLIEAYNGYYEDERVVQQDDGSFKEVAAFSKEEWNTWIQWKIIHDSPLERLERYLEWNGIQGYTETVYNIAMGKFSV